MTNYEKYLGLPMVTGKSKVGTFKGLQERITKKVMGWKEKTISKAGRERSEERRVGKECEP